MILRIVAVSAFLATGQILLKLAMPVDAKGMGAFPLLISLLTGWRFWLACLCTGLGALLWMVTVAAAPIGIAYPVMVSLSLILVVGAESIFFQRALNRGWLMGTVLIIVGIWLVTRVRG